MGRGIIVVSACLVGVNCKYNGGNNEMELLKKPFSSGKVLPLCPEQLGGLPTPREPAQISGGSGEDVLAGRARVVALESLRDITQNFVRGAYETLNLVEKLSCLKCVILKERSPSCGVKNIYSFESGEIVEGMGVAAALLASRGYEIVSSDDEDRIKKVLEEI